LTESNSTNSTMSPIHACHERLESYQRGSGGGGSTGKWKDASVPKDGWTCVEIEDLGEVAATCEMCEREHIRFVHTMVHPAYGELDVGCICAGHMSGDLDLVKKKQDTLQGRLARRERFPDLRNWKVSRPGNRYIEFERKGIRYWVVITQSHGKFSAMVENKSKGGKEFLKGSKTWFSTPREAQLAAFDHLFPPKMACDNRQQDRDHDDFSDFDQQFGYSPEPDQD